MKTTWFVIAFLFAGVTALCQGSRGVVQLKGGTKLKGLVTHAPEGGSLFVAVGHIEDHPASDIS